jgi:hypothetical protein
VNKGGLILSAYVGSVVFTNLMMHGMDTIIIIYILPFKIDNPITPLRMAMDSSQNM